MRKLVSIALLSLANMGLDACKYPTPNNEQVRTLSAHEYCDKLAAMPSSQLVDVRTSAEFASGHLKNAININYKADDFGERIGRLDKGKAIFVYCRSGARSSAAARQMQEAGFRSLYDLEGGIMDWQQAGLPVEE